MGQQQSGGQQQAGQQQGARSSGPRLVYDASSLNQSQLSQIQQALNKNGFDAGNVDGNWGPETRTAIQNFQRAKGFEQTGQLDKQTTSALGLQLDQASLSYDTQELSREQIRQVEQSLNQKGFSAGDVDGTWDSSTRSALLNFQKSQGMKETGRLDQKTASSLGVDFAQPQGGGQTTGSASQQRNTQQPRNAQDQNNAQPQQGGQSSGKQ